MKRVNLPLIIGIILLIILLLIVAYPEKFTEIDPNYAKPHKLSTVIKNGKEVPEVQFPPWGPNEENIMGVDEIGRDIYSRLIYGAKTTLKTVLSIVLVRLILAIPIGLMAAMGNKFFSKIIMLFNTVFTTIPIILISFFIFNIQYISSLELKRSIWAFSIILGFLGWSKLAKQIEEKGLSIMNEDFIEGEVAIGKSKMQILIQNILPHILPFLISISFMEVGLVIFLLSQLSIFLIFVGPRQTFILVEGMTGITTGVNPEWGAMLSRIVVNNKIGNYWIGLYPALAFAFGILAFNLIGKGLMAEYEKENSKIVSNIHRIFYILSPKTFINEMRNFKRNKFKVITKTSSIVLILLLIFAPKNTSKYKIDIDNVYGKIDKFIENDYQKSKSGYSEHYEFADEIIDELQSYGFIPARDDFVQKYNNNFKFDLDYQNIKIEQAHIKIGDRKYQIGEDFNILTINNRDIERIKNNEDLISEKDFKNKNIIIEKISNDIFKQIDEELHYNYYIDEVLWTEKIEKSEEYIKIVYGTKLIVSEEMKVKIENNEEFNLVIEKYEIPSNEMRNIIAVKPSEKYFTDLSKNDREELVILGVSYDQAGIDNKFTKIGFSNISLLLEIGRTLSDVELDKTVVFALWDGVNGNDYGKVGQRYYNLKDRYFTQDRYDITYIEVGNISDMDTVLVNIFSPATFQIETYKVTENIKEWFEKNKVNYRLEEGYGSIGFQEIGYNMPLKIDLVSDYNNFDYYNETYKDQYILPNRNQIFNIGQFIVDIITKENYLR